MSGNNEGGDDEFSTFEAAGEVEVGESNLASQEKVGEKAGEGDGEEKPEKKASRRGPPKSAPKAEAKSAVKADEGEEEGGEEAEKPKPKAKPKAGEGEADEGDEEEEAGEGDEEEEEQEEKPKKEPRKPSDRIRELTRRLRDKDRLVDSLAARLDSLEKRGLPSDQGGGKQKTEEVPAPDPTDTEKYPLGHLDDRYIEDKLEWLAEDKAARRADAVLHRQQEAEQTRAAEQSQRALLEKVDDLAKIGDELYDDFQESVVDAGMRGDWDLSQATFEAAHEVENGAQILYELAQDKKEASRVAKLSNFQQMKFVQERDAEIGKGKKPRKIPQAGEPPLNQARGANSRTQINPATDNLDDFEKAWERDAKKAG